MKVGIITFHFPHNYGAMLQAYAFQEKLRSMGCETYIIDYRPSYHTKWYSRGICIRDIWSYNPFTLVRNLLKYCLCQPTQNNRYNSFDNFLNKCFDLYPYNKESDMSTFDMVFLGSDQIWDLNHTNNVFDGPYYGDGFKCRVASYAASSKMKALTDEQKRGFQEKLNNLYSIGVREISFKELLQPLINKEISVNLDPTLMVDMEAFERLDLSRPVKKTYVLIYELYEHKQVTKMAYNYAKKINAKVVSLVAFFDWKKRGKYYDQEASPEKFLAYIKHAECIFTTSFHGTALSIVFRKQFFTFRQNTTSDLRMESLLSQLGLLDNFVEMSSVLKDCKVDYSSIQQKLNKLRQESNDYIRKALSFNN